jgi:GT2 family glycosyltransferase
MSQSVAVIVPNWNGARLLPACFSALAQQTYTDFLLYVVDNGSTDGSWEMLAALNGRRKAGWLDAELPYPVRVIRNEVNLGFAEANNQAIKLALAGGCHYVATLNNDAVAEPDWLHALIHTVRNAPPQVGMIASTMLFAHRPERVASAGISIHHDGLALDRSVGAVAADLEKHGVRPVFGPSAGAALYSTDMLCDSGLFDARFFSYLEDADLAWRARARGWKALHTPHARVLHEYSATGGQGSSFKNRLVARNRVWLLYKNMPAPLLRRFWPVILRYDLAASAAGLVTGNREALLGRLEALRALPLFTFDRRVNIAAARLHPSEQISLLTRPLSPSAHARYSRKLASLVAGDPESPRPQ